MSKSKFQIKPKIKNLKNALTFNHSDLIWHWALGFWICAILFGSVLYASAQTGPISSGIVHCTGDPCTLCDLSILADRLTRFLLFNVMLPIAALMILIGGVMLLTARDNQQQQAQGKSVLTYAVWGMIIAFAAWLIVSTLLATLGYKGTWYAFPDPSQCIAATTGTNGETNDGSKAYCIFNGQTRCSNVGSCEICTNEGAEGCATSKPSECGGNNGSSETGYCVSPDGRSSNCSASVNCASCQADGWTCTSSKPSVCNQGNNNNNGNNNGNNGNSNGQALFYCWRSPTGEGQDNCNPSASCNSCFQIGGVCSQEKPLTC